MNRAFISLYLFIVVSVVLVGWGLDKFWEKLAPAQETSVEIADLMQVFEDQWLREAPEDKNVWIAHQQKLMKQRISLLLLDDIAGSQASEQLLAGQLIGTGNSDGGISWYRRLGDSQQVLVITTPAPDAAASAIYSGLLVVFYLAIAVVIFFWVWPLSRHLRRLESHTRNIGRDGAPEPVSISPRSTVYPLANAFNKMALRIRELIASHKEMTYAVSHELRTPLARMKFALAMNEDQQSQQQQQKTLASLRQDIAEMESLISSLLVYAGFEQSSGVLDARPGHMREMLDQLLARIRREKPDGLVIDIVDKTSGEVFVCEWKLMETALQNLVQNARRYAREKICILLWMTESHYCLAVEDDGPGVAEENRERIFESFVRLYNENSPQASGFGLGLAIVRRILRWHGGEAKAETASLGGARMVLSWPRVSD
jgi:two-component system OmpR family sensor kinase